MPSTVHNKPEPGGSHGVPITLPNVSLRSINHQNFFSGTMSKLKRWRALASVWLRPTLTVHSEKDQAQAVASVGECLVEANPNRT